MANKDIKKKVVGFTCGTYDLCHAGHFLVFKECKNVCDYLIVGLQTDPSFDRPKNKPIMSVEERLEILSGIKYIDEIILYTLESDLYDYLKANHHKIDVRIMGEDWKGKPFTGHDLPIAIHFSPRGHNYSTSQLRRRVHEAELLKVL